MKAKPILKQKDRRQLNREAVIEDILTIAREMMQAEGVAALSFNAIARRLGMKPPSLYTYFDSKDAIYDMLFRRGFEEFGRRVRERPDRDGSVEENLASAITNYMSFAQENPDLYQLMFQRPVPGFEPSEESMAVSLGVLQGSIEEMAQIIAQGEIDTKGIPLDEGHDLVIALMHGLTELHLANNPDLPVGEGRFGKLVDHAVKLIMDAWSLDNQ
jgi:AcrR family transcriptional regulator